MQYCEGSYHVHQVYSFVKQKYELFILILVILEIFNQFKSLDFIIVMYLILFHNHVLNRHAMLVEFF